MLLLADGIDYEKWAKLLGFPIAIVTLGYGTLMFLKLWRDLKLTIQDRFVGRWEWDLDGQVLEVAFRPDGTWDGRVVTHRGIMGALFGLFSGGRISGSWFIATSNGRTVNVREASGKWHVEDRIKKVKKDRITLVTKGELVRVPAASDVVEEPAPAAAATPPPLPPQSA